ncbi:zinc finger domain-containing protein [Pedobacter gandavensis]|uniref:zinc finger domain-containing protein n=1 Tax=Pedobacter gandavensis TaxID=2679963 RepID=UPI002930E715|nr:hypothetical protein [Pedobacter gandavensis]
MNNTIQPSVLNLSLKCNGCGALLYFTPGSKNLKCDHCGQSNAIETNQSYTTIKSFDYELFIDRINQHKITDDKKVVNCSNCGSQTVLSSFTSSDKCSFCTAPLVLSPQAGQQYLPPHYILPFEINQQQAILYFQKWLKGLWWAPNDLAKKVSASASNLQGIYLPHWTYDTDTITGYDGRRGDYYYTTEEYTVTENNKTETRTRQVRHTRWSAVSGKVDCKFRDLIVSASNSLPTETLKDLAPWNFKLLVKFDERYMSGFRSETYQTDPQQGLLMAFKQTQDKIRSEIEHDIGGDEQEVGNTTTEYLNKAIKYIMLPVWVSAYDYHNKIYQFTVNASTGEVIGKRPLSWIKIVLFVFMILILITIVVACI